jgi:two-component system nitrogen regulation response regulator NtrX
MRTSAVTSRILVVDDDAKVRGLLTDLLTEQGYEVSAAADGTEAIDKSVGNELNLILLDYQLPDFDGLYVLEQVKRVKPALPVIMMSGYGTIKLAVETTKHGAYDFLEKPLDANRVLVTVKNALEKDALQRQVATLSAETLVRYEMVGTSPAMQRLYQMVDRVAPSKANVLIIGESGVGKELAARAIHHKSLVSSGPFVRVNCAAIPQELIESELFGHEKGAFTGAVGLKPGRLELADHGTAFLDEVGDMNLYVQAKLLRFLQEGEFEHVGGTRTLKVDVRVIAATNKNLLEEMKQHRFREDLYYRLNVVRLEVPPLRERKEDIPLLAEHFLGRYSDEHGVARRVLSEDALNVLVNQSWPGNIRELANFMQRCVVLLPEQHLTAKEIAPLLAAGCGSPHDDHVGRSLRGARDEFDRTYVMTVLNECAWNMTEAAKVLEIDRTSLYRMMERLGITAAHG